MLYFFSVFFFNLIYIYAMLSIHFIKLALLYCLDPLFSEYIDSLQFLKMMDQCWQSHCRQMVSRLISDVVELKNSNRIYTKHSNKKLFFSIVCTIVLFV